MIESSYRPRFGGCHPSSNYHNGSLASPEQLMNGQTKNNFGFSPAGSRPSSSTSQNCFSGSSVYAGPSDISSVACPENHIYNPIAIGHATGLAPPLCISGMEPSPQYPALSPVYDVKNGPNDVWQLGYGQPSPYSYDSAYGPQFSYPSRYCGMDFDESVRRKNATRESTNTLKSWLQEHKKNPYPTKGEKIMLAIITKMTLTQVSTWFANARRRLKKENKMTWVPKNRSSDANSSGSSKKNTDDEEPDDVNDDVAASLPEENDGRNNTLPTLNDDDFDQFENEQDSNNGIKHNDNPKLLVTEPSSISMNNVSTSKISTQSVPPIDPLKPFGKSTKPTHEKNNVGNHFFPEPNQKFTRQSNISSVEDSLRLPHPKSMEVYQQFSSTSSSTDIGCIRTTINTNLSNSFQQGSVNGMNNATSNVHLTSSEAFSSGYFLRSLPDKDFFPTDRTAACFSNPKPNKAVEKMEMNNGVSRRFAERSQSVTSESSAQHTFQNTFFLQNGSYLSNKLQYFSSQDDFNQLDPDELDYQQQSYQPY